MVKLMDSFQRSSIRAVEMESCEEEVESRTESDPDESFGRLNFRSKKLIRSKQSKIKTQNRAKQAIVGLNRKSYKKHLLLFLYHI